MLNEYAIDKFYPKIDHFRVCQLKVKKENWSFNMNVKSSRASQSFVYSLNVTLEETGLETDLIGNIGQ